jgi:hypothetical protein
MEKSSRGHKMILNRETVRELSHAEMDRVGGAYPRASDSCPERTSRGNNCMTSSADTVLTCARG